MKIDSKEKVITYSPEEERLLQSVLDEVKDMDKPIFKEKYDRAVELLEKVESVKPVQ